MTDPLKFFRKKKPWSSYKDLILNYYLEPYLAKVARLRRPIMIVDCFAGPGQFDDGQPGSPLLISARLEQAQQRGAEVLGYYVEKNPVLYDRLVANTQGSRIPVHVRRGDFREHIDEVSRLARDSTVFVYLDPIRPSDLFFSDMDDVYRNLESGRSVEVLINFMSSGFLRAVRGLRNLTRTDQVVPTENEGYSRWNSVAGGPYWQKIVFDDGASNRERIERLAKGYARRLNERFAWVIKYPIQAKYEDKFPKYHLTFGSRHPAAIELMNRAMVRARREFVGARFIKGCLFPNQPDREVIRPEEIEKIILETCRALGKTTWSNLRVRTTIAYPCVYMDSEFDQAIKRAIREGKIGSNASGRKTEGHASVWPI